MDKKRAELLTSARNPLLRDIRRSIARGELTPDGCCVAETFHLLEEALRSDCPVPAVLSANSVRSTVERHISGLNGSRFFVVPDEIFQEVAATESSQGVIALVKPPAWTLEQLFRGQALVLVLDGVQDPGNAGAMVRAAEAFGASGLMFLKGTVSPYNPKTVRASAGSLFRIPVVSAVDPTLAKAALEQKRLDVYAASPTGKKALSDADLSRRCALIVGSEGRGVSDKLRNGAFDLRIPTSGVESLNAAMAAGILLYEARRQRMRD